MLDRILITNDDGIDAPGLRALETIAGQLAREVWTVAPEHDQSGTSHALSLHVPLRVARRSERRFGVLGTPGDCVALAVRHLMPEPPDLVLSGVNRGANLGVETVFSGTVGAAMTAMLLGFRAMGLSQAFTDRDNVRWATAEAHGASTVARLLAIDGWAAAGACLNLNFPDVPADRVGPLRFTRQGVGVFNDIGVRSEQDPRGIDYHWLQLKRSPTAEADDSESAVVRGGGIAVTPLQFERTHEGALALLANS